MCGRYTLANPEYIKDRYNISSDINIEANYNASPSTQLPIIVSKNDGEMKLILMKWGLIPFWAKDEKIGNNLINARAESITTKPSFKKAFKSQRCLIPADGFFEWKKEGNQKIPYYIKLKDQDIFSFAGLYDTWENQNSNQLKTFTIITTEPSESIKNIHNRMPVILSEKEDKVWLDNNSSEDELSNLLDSYESNQLDFYIVGKEVNNPAYNNSENISRILNDSK